MASINAAQFCFSGGNMPQKGDRITMMFSATFPSEVQELAKGKLVLSALLVKLQFSV